MSTFKHNRLSSLNVVEFDPLKFGISIQNKPKRSIDVRNYFNLDFFAVLKDGVISAGNLADCGIILSQSKDMPTWINTSRKQLSTIYVLNDGSVGQVKTNDLTKIKNLKTAISGIPVYPKVGMNAIKEEGYFGNELYNTSHSFLAIRQNKLVYVGTSCGFESMASIFEGLGCKYAVKLDGGGSYILQVNGGVVASTAENRRINAIGMFE